MQQKPLFATKLLMALVLVLICGLKVVARSAMQNRLVTVVVLDLKSRQPIVGAVVRSGQTGAATDINGRCKLSFARAQTDKAKNSVELTVTIIGYKPIERRAYPLASEGQDIIVYMGEDTHLLKGVEITEQRKEADRTQQSVAISQEKLERSPSLSLSQLLETVPGVSSISTGSTIGKPVIQGMHSSRILLINNGIRLETQSWGADHAPEIDHTAATVVEVIKGAESVRYGYGAMGGVVIFNQAELPFGNDRFAINGKANIGYSTNGRGYDGAASVEGGYENFGFRLHGMYQKAGDYSTAEYILNNTGFNNISFSGLMGYKYRGLTAKIYASLFTARNGVYYASKITDMDQLLLRVESGRPGEETFRPFSYRIEPPMQQTQHLMLKTELQYKFNPKHRLEFTASYQDNLRQEFENRKVRTLSWLPVQDLVFTTFDGELVWFANWGVKGMTTQAGGSWLYQYNYNNPGTKQPPYIPNYTALTMGGYFIHKLQLGYLTLSAGGRYDVRAQDISGYTSLSSFKFYDDFRFYRNATGTIAAHYDFNENWELRANLGWAWRPPDINELYATGLHQGTYWVVGNDALDSERGWKAILGSKYHNSRITVEPSVFYQNVKNYIYDSIGKGNERFHNHPSGKYPKFFYGQDDVRLIGGDIFATIVPLKGLTINASGEWLSAWNITQQNWLPYMPSDRYMLSGDYKFTLGKEAQWNMAFNLEGNLVTKQSRFDPEKDLVPETPPAYFLLNGSAEVGYELGNGKNLKVMLIGNNMLNTLYKEYTDRFRYFAHARGAQFTVRTIFSF